MVKPGPVVVLTFSFPRPIYSSNVVWQEKASAGMTSERVISRTTNVWLFPKAFEEPLRLSHAK